MANTMDKLRELSASLKADATALRRDGVWGCCAGTYDYAAAHIDAIVRESDAQVPVAATLDEAAADPALTLDVARELLRDAAAGIRSLAASATSEPDADLELIWHSVSDNAETNAAYRRLKARLAALNPKRRESECPWGGCGDCVGHEVTQPAGDGARVTDAERHDMERKARELLAVEYERRGSRRMAEGIRSTPAAEFGDRDLGCAVRAIVAALAAREPDDGARVTEADRELRERAGQMILRLGQFALIQRRRRYPKNAKLAAECAELLAALAAREGGAS